MVILTLTETDTDFFIFKTDSGSKYLYDANTASVHPLPSEVTKELIREIYSCEDQDELTLMSGATKDKNVLSFLRYVSIWRSSAGAFFKGESSGLFQLTDIKSAWDSQFITGLPCDLILITSEECNMRCAYCVYEDELYPNRRTHRSNKMDWHTSQKAIDLYLSINSQKDLKIYDKRALNIVFYGGEPLLNWPVVEKSILYARTQYKGDNELHIGMTTNLTLLDKKWLPFLREHDVFLNVSLDGSKEEHDRYRHFENQSPTFDVVMRNLALIHDYDENYFNRNVKAMVTTNGNTDFLSVVDFFENNPIAPYIQFVSTIKDFENSKFHEVYPYDKTKYLESLKALRNSYETSCISGKSFRRGGPYYAMLHDYYENFFHAPHNISKSKNWYTGICIPGRKLAVVPDGNIYLCERTSTNRPVGFVDTGLDEQLLLSYFNDYFRISEQCHSCWARNKCSICPAEVDSLYHFDFKGRCERVRCDVENSLVFLYSLLEKKPTLFANEYPFY